MSEDLENIIGDINRGNGDLTSRLEPKTKSEFVLIADNVNQFLCTLQNVIKDVKVGTDVLQSSSDSMVGRIQSATNNVTNTSAAMQELSAHQLS